MGFDSPCRLPAFRGDLVLAQERWEEPLPRRLLFAIEDGGEASRDALRESLFLLERAPEAAYADCGQRSAALARHWTPPSHDITFSATRSSCTTFSMMKPPRYRCLRWTLNPSVAKKVFAAASFCLRRHRHGLGRLGVISKLGPFLAEMIEKLADCCELPFPCRVVRISGLGDILDLILEEADEWQDGEAVGDHHRQRVTLHHVKPLFTMYKHIEKLTTITVNVA